MIHTSASSLMQAVTGRRQVLVCLMLCSVFMGCSAYPLGFARKRPPRYFPPMHGVDDPVFHGHQKTCWKNWDDAGWSAIPCPEYNCPPQVPVVFEQPIQQAPPADEVQPMETESDSSSFELPTEPMLLPPMEPPEIPFPGE